MQFNLCMFFFLLLLCVIHIHMVFCRQRDRYIPFWTVNSGLSVVSRCSLIHFIISCAKHPCAVGMHRNCKWVRSISEHFDGNYNILQNTKSIIGYETKAIYCTGYWVVNLMGNGSRLVFAGMLWWWWCYCCWCFHKLLSFYDILIGGKECCLYIYMPSAANSILRDKNLQWFFVLCLVSITVYAKLYSTLCALCLFNFDGGEFVQVSSEFYYDFWVVFCCLFGSTECMTLGIRWGTAIIVGFETFKRKKTFFSFILREM